MKFQAEIIPSGNATGVEIPDDVMHSLGPEARPLITITINGHRWRSRVAAMRGQRLIGISAANRAAAGIREGDVIEIDVERDVAPRVAIEPGDVSSALDASPQARAAFERLPFSLRQKHINAIEQAKSAEVRQRRIRKLVENLHGATPHKH